MTSTMGKSVRRIVSERMVRWVCWMSTGKENKQDGAE